MKLIDIHGKRFGRLTVLAKASESRKWLCQCDCGRDVLVIGGNLRNGSSKSCGCLALEWSRSLGANRDFIAKRAATVTIHGHKRRGRPSPEYRTWLGMKRRCYDPKFKDYPNWGGRGIEVCDRWNASFEAFLADMGQRPHAAPSIDRIDPDGNYEPGNCRWASISEQAAEHRRGLIETSFDGVVYPSLRAACRALNLSYGAVFQRLSAGLPIEQALTVTRAELTARRPRTSYLPRTHPDRSA